MGGCVETAPNLPQLVPVQDSKRPARHAITFGHDAWRAFISELPDLGCRARHTGEIPRSTGNPVARVNRCHRSGAGDP
ncbi:DUF397 domain-containing protein [Streptomyces cyaneofuscatus]|uniref:DUF397 domain-containing protein n=1 Tax=Streptomyces cyaneofuscatus TaxID=66883 RepID=UPI0033E3E0AE